jgi:hypothetical protein
VVGHRLQGLLRQRGQAPAQVVALQVLLHLSKFWN